MTSIKLRSLGKKKGGRWQLADRPKGELSFPAILAGATFGSGFSCRVALNQFFAKTMRWLLDFTPRKFANGGLRTSTIIGDLFLCEASPANFRK
jgi:hypothetical protein